MSESSAPWRALEDPPGPVSGGAGPNGVPAATSGATAPPVRWLAIAGFGLAAILLGAALLLIVSSGTGAVAIDGGGAPASRAPNASGSAGTVTSEAFLVIDVQGAVLRPGVVRLPAGSRVADAIEAAGGYGPRVAADRVGQALNLAAELKDGDQVVVPSRDDPAGTGPTAPLPGGAAVGTGGSGSGPVDLNRATAAELDALPGIGPVTAAKIIAARDEQPFTSVEDLRTRKVLGAATLEKIKDLVVVR
jgi:competence protein ComEA